MIHNNLRKIIRWQAHKGTAYSSSEPYIINFTDITGYTGSSYEDDNAGKDMYASNGGFILSNQYQLTSSTLSSKINSTSQFVYIQIGNTITNEPDYNLGTVLSNDMLCSTEFDFGNTCNAIWIGTITNDTNNDVSFNEVGLFIHLKTSGTYWNESSSNYTQRCFLLVKEVLPQSMTLEANSSVTFSFNILGDVIVT